MKEFWDNRYASESYVFGEEPNVFFREQLDQLPAGRLLLPAEGEGRNAVYAARKGWRVSAFDMSEQACRKAEQLADKHGVSLAYKVAAMPHIDYPTASFDLAALIFVHFPDDKQRQFHSRIWSWVKPGGRLILEGYHKTHITYREKYGSVGGPGTEAFMYELESLLHDFPGAIKLVAQECDVDLAEGENHTGLSRVVRLHLQKP